MVGHELPKPLLEDWAQKQMKGEAILLTPSNRDTVEHACTNHCEFRNWDLLAVNARTNHVHAVVAANVEPTKIRDQLKANCTRELREATPPLNVPRTWTRGGDCEILFTKDDVESAVIYVKEAQDTKHN
jgi:REP element-mobilizing transposase RayT